jgi:hypothetical protein
MSHPALWASVCKRPEELRDKILSLDQSSRCWVKLSEKKGQRFGVYKVSKLDEHTCVAYFVDESEPNEDYQSIEAVLKSDGCLPDGTEVPAPVPKASKAVIFFDLKNGLCYVYTPGIASSEDSVILMLERLNRDTGMPCDPKTFEWKDDFPTEMYHVAKGSGFVPYRVEADLATVKIKAEGNLSENERWKKIEGSLESEVWNTIAYVQSGNSSKFIFGIARRMKKFVSIPETEEKSEEEVYQDVMTVKSLFEKAIGTDIRQYLFPQAVSTLHNFTFAADSEYR